MKKETIAIVGLVIFILLGIITVLGVNYSIMVGEYETKIEELSEDNVKLSEEINELSENIYNVFEKQPYKISIDRDGEYITYQQDKFGWFDSYSKSTITY